MVKNLQVNAEFDLQPPPYESTIKPRGKGGSDSKLEELQQLWSQHRDPDETRSRSPFQSAVGVSLAVVAGVLFGLATVFINLTESGGGSSIQILFLQNVLCVLVVAPLIYYWKTPIFAYRKPEKGLMLLNAVAETVGRITLYFAFRYGLTGNVSSVTFGALPIITPLFAGIGLGERWRLVDALNSLINIAGIILIAGPSFIFSENANDHGEADGQSSAKDVAVSTVLSLLTAVSFSVSAVSIHAISHVPIFVILLYTGTIGAAFTFPAIFIRSVVSWNLSLQVCAFIFAESFCYLLGALCFISALQMESAATVVLLANVQICIAYVGDVVVFGDIVQVWDIVGSVLILASSAIVALYTWWKHNHEVSNGEVKAAE